MLSLLAVPGDSVRAEDAEVPREEALCYIVGPCGDVNFSATLSAADALLVLKSSVGQPVSLLCAIGGGGAANAVPLRTGQTQCVDAATGDSINCAGTGQDGESRTGKAPRFSENADGTILDKWTGLVWEKLDRKESGGNHRYDVQLTWNEAFLKVAVLNVTNFAGFNDWRLPNVRELQTLTQFGASMPAVWPPFLEDCSPDCDLLDCSCTHGDLHWTSTTLLRAPASAWVVDFNDGGTYANPKISTATARAVRRGGSGTADLLRSEGGAAGVVIGVCELVGPCGDVNASGAVTASDALAILQRSVGQPVDLQCGVVPASPSTSAVLRTGQTTCFNTAGSPIACAGTGQDGESASGVFSRFEDNGDGTITDEATGLTWEKLGHQPGDVHDGFATYEWQEALGKIDQLNAAAFAGHDDWRLPNQRELHTLSDFGRNDPAVDPVFHSSCIPGCAPSACSCTISDFHWTSTNLHGVATSAWAIDLFDGLSTGDPKTYTASVRAVRSEE